MVPTSRARFLVALASALLTLVQCNALARADASATPVTTTPAGQLLYGPDASEAFNEPGSTVTPVVDQVVAAASLPQYSSYYGGAAFGSNGGLTIYATASGAAPLAAALSTEFGSSVAGAYAVDVVPRSLYELESDTLATEETGIPAKFESPTSSPFVIVSFHPDSLSGTVEFSVIGTASVAQATLTRLLPGIPISVVESDALGLPTPDSGRYADVSPFSAGDAINIAGHSGGPCTANFTFIGNNSGNLYPFTAGHCDPNGAGAAVTTAAGTPISSISTKYGPPNVDFASYLCNNCQGHVWYTASATHSVLGQCSCYGTGNSVTMDGQATGEVPGFQVQWSAPGCVLSICGAEYAVNGSVSYGCQGGDSGGPVYQREGNPLGSYVEATGLLLYDGAGNNDCYYQVINQIESSANVGLLSGV